MKDKKYTMYDEYGWEIRSIDACISVPFHVGKKIAIKILNILNNEPSSSCPSSIKRQQKCDNCMIGYYDFCHEAWLIYKEEESKYDKDDVGITWFKYCPACGYETNLAD